MAAESRCLAHFIFLIAKLADHTDRQSLQALPIAVEHLLFEQAAVLKMIIL